MTRSSDASAINLWDGKKSGYAFLSKPIDLMGSKQHIDAATLRVVLEIHAKVKNVCHIHESTKDSLTFTHHNETHNRRNRYPPNQGDLVHARPCTSRGVLLLTVLTFNLGFSQEYRNLLKEAQLLHYKGHFDSASHIYALAITNGANDPSVFVDAAACFASIGNRDTAFYFLRQALSRGWGDLHWIEHDEQLSNLRNDRRWIAFLVSARTSISLLETSLDTSIRRELFAMRYIDQKARRNLLARMGPLQFRGNYRLGFLLTGVAILVAATTVILVWKKQSPACRTAGFTVAFIGICSSAFFLASVLPYWLTALTVKEIDRNNTERMKHIVQKVGWPGNSLVGEDGAEVAWLLVQHADQDIQFQKSILPLIEEAAKKGEATFVQATNLKVRIQQKER
ncbi:MAG: DUF6624 domain-containing protein [Bacteroidota bacterium]